MDAERTEPAPSEDKGVRTLEDVWIDDGKKDGEDEGAGIGIGKQD